MPGGLLYILFGYKWLHWGFCSFYSTLFQSICLVHLNLVSLTIYYMYVLLRMCIRGLGGPHQLSETWQPLPCKFGKNSRRGVSRGSHEAEHPGGSRGQQQSPSNPPPPPPPLLWRAEGPFHQGIARHSLLLRKMRETFLLLLFLLPWNIYLAIFTTGCRNTDAKFTSVLQTQNIIFFHQCCHMIYFVAIYMP